MQEADEAADFVVCVNARKLVRSVCMWVSRKGDAEYRLLLRNGKVYSSKRLGKLLRLAVVHDAMDSVLDAEMKGKQVVAVKVPPSWQGNEDLCLSVRTKLLLLACLLHAERSPRMTQMFGCILSLGASSLSGSFMDMMKRILKG